MQVLRVRGRVARSHAAQVLQDGDLVLAVNGQPVTSYGHVEGIIGAGSFSRADAPPQAPTSAAGQTAGAEPAAAAASSTSLSESVGSAGSFESKAGGPDSKAGKACAAHMPHSPQPDSSLLIKAARHSSPALQCEDKGAFGMPQVSLTIFRAPVVEEVRVQLGSEDGLGTCRLVHWCGALFQVSILLIASARGFAFLSPDL